LASGPLIVRDGDIFGRTVNLAARIADAAPDGRLYVPEDVVSSLGGDLFKLQPAGDAHLQGIGRIALVDVGRAPRRSPGD
jgi:class 3 adenylate cyclase